MNEERGIVRYASTGEVALREDAAGDGRTISGYAYRWGTYTRPYATEEHGALQEGFEPGAFADAIASRGERPWPFLDRHLGNTVAGIRFTEDETGLRYDGRLNDTAAAREYALTIPDGNDGVSLELVLRGAQSRRGRGTITHMKVPRIAALAGAYAPAFDGATVAIRSESGGNTTMGDELALTVTEPTTGALITAERPTLTPDQVAKLATDAAVEVMRQYAERGALQTVDEDPLAQYSSLGELYLAAAQPGAEPELRAYAARAIAKRALADIVTTAGANAGLTSGNLVVADIKRLVEQSRKAITAFGGPRALGDSVGLTLEWAYFDGTLTDYVAAQSAQKAEIESAAVDIKLDTEALITYAGGADIAYQLIRRGNPSILDAFSRIVLAAWAVVTDAAFCTELESGSTTQDLAEALTAVDLTELIGHFVDASVAVEAATGMPAQFVLASTTAYKHAAKLVAPSSTQIVAAGELDLRGLRVSVGNLPIIHAPGITAGKFIASNELAAGWFEDGPFQAAAEDVAKLGRNVAYWSMGAGARFIPAGIVEIYDVTP